MEKHFLEETQPWRKSEGRRSEVEKMRKEKNQKREDAGARKGKSRETLCFFHCFVAPEG